MRNNGLLLSDAQESTVNEALRTFNDVLLGVIEEAVDESYAAGYSDGRVFQGEDEIQQTQGRYDGEASRHQTTATLQGSDTSYADGYASGQRDGSEQGARAGFAEGFTAGKYFAKL